MKLFDKYMARAMKLHDRADKFYFEGSRNWKDYLPAYDDLKDEGWNPAQRLYIITQGIKKANILEDYSAASSWELNHLLNIAKMELKQARVESQEKVIPNHLQRFWLERGHKDGIADNFSAWERILTGNA